MASVFRLATIRPRTIILIREGVKMLIAVLTALLAFSGIIFLVSRLVKEKTAEQKERAAEEEKEATPDPKEFH